jgi:hypothetical protein
MYVQMPNKIIVTQFTPLGKQISRHFFNLHVDTFLLCFSEKGLLARRSRVARRYIFKTKIQIWVFLEGLEKEDVCTF